MTNKLIAHVDGNNFFVGCETFINPSLKGKAVCVLSNNDGCIISRSNEAKKLGIPMGIPLFMAKKNFSNVIYLSANFTLYQDLSQRIMNFLTNYTDKIEVYSIDEAFLDLTGTEKVFQIPHKELAIKIKNEIEKNIGISVSVGISTSKILAKTATYKAKSRNGAYVIEPHLIQVELENIPVEKIWGIGKNTARSLRKFGIFYANEIPLKDDNFYKTNFGKKGMELKYELMGESVIPFSFGSEKPKSLQRTSAFPEFSSEKQYIKSELKLHLHSICKKLRENKQETCYIAVMLRTKDFRIFYKECKLEFYTNTEILLQKKVEELFNMIYSNELIYRSSGIIVSSLRDTNKVQLTLFNEQKQKKSKSISDILDKIENKFGKGSISIGDTGIKSVMEKHKRKMRFRTS